MSYKDGKKEGTVDLVCDHKGCSNKVSSTKRGEAWATAREKGWLGKSAKEHYCPTHKVEHGARDPKAAKKAAGKKAAASKKKGTGTPVQGGRVWKYTPKSNDTATE